eukprot:gene11393-11541_t
MSTAAKSPNEELADEFSKCVSGRIAAVSSLQVIPRSHRMYPSMRVRNFQRHYHYRHPLVFGLPKTEEDVVALIMCANTHGMPFTARGGGHSYVGNSLVQDGLVIDFDLMDDIEVHWDKGTVSIGAGQRLGEVYKILMELGNFTLPAGQCAGVGISGFTAGGGLGQATRKLGWLSDSLISVQGVTAEGEVILASSTENPDLFWAIRGGGANYIIVTQWEFKLATAPEVFSIVGVDFPTTKAAEAIAAYLDWRPWQLPSDWALVEAAVHVHNTSTNGSVIKHCYMYAFYWGKAEDAIRVLRGSGMLQVPGATIGTVKQGSWSEMLPGVTGQPSLKHMTKEHQLAAQYIGWGSPFGTSPPEKTGYRNFKAGSIMFPGIIPAAAQHTLLTAVKGLATVAGHTSGGFVQFKALGGPVLDRIPPSSTALPHRDVLIETQIYAAGDNYSLLDAAVAQVKSAMLPYSAHPYYYNYFDCDDVRQAAAASGGDAFDAYFGRNAAALRGIKSIYDPHNRIQGMFCGE